MDKRLAALAGLQAGTFSAAEARAQAIDSEAVRVARRAGDIVRVRRGAYVATTAWKGADADERFRLTCMAIARSRLDDVLSHHAALALHRLPLWGHDPKRVDLVSDVRQVVYRDGIGLHPRLDGGVTYVDGVGAVPVARAIVRTALTMGRDCAVVAGDQALHHGVVTHEELIDEVARVTPHQGRARAMEAVTCMDEKAESVGESRTRLIFIDAGMAWESQVLIEDERGAVIGRVDFEVDGVVVEFDGKVKYRVAPDTDAVKAGEVVWLEKRREDSIRRQGRPVERVVWAELDRPGLIVSRVRAAAPKPASTAGADRPDRPDRQQFGT